MHIVRRAIGNDTGGLGEAGEAQWDILCRNHMVLTELYPEMREYRAALAELSFDADITEEAYQATEALLNQGEESVEPAVPHLVREKLTEDTTGDPEAERRRGYNVAAMLNTTAVMLWNLIEILPRLSNAATAAASLWGRFWLLLRAVLEKAGWW